MIHRSLGLALLLLLPIGCGNREYALVSVAGRVTLDGKPVSGATVSFEPTETQGTGPYVGVGSTGETDAEGNFRLTSVRGESGAVVGTHRVQISTLRYAEDEDSDSGGGQPIAQKERIPARYNTKSELTFDVPGGGTDEANFELSSK